MVRGGVQGWKEGGICVREKRQEPHQIFQYSLHSGNNGTPEVLRSRALKKGKKKRRNKIFEKTFCKVSKWLDVVCKIILEDYM